MSARERVSGRNQVLLFHTEGEEKNEVTSTKMRWERRRGGGQKGEDDPRRMMSLAKTVGKAVYVSLFFSNVYTQEAFCVCIMCNFYMEE